MNSSGWIRMREMIFFEYRELDRGREDRRGRFSCSCKEVREH